MKSWSSNPDCSTIIRECRSVYDKFFPDVAEQFTGTDEDVRMEGPDHDVEGDEVIDEKRARKKPVPECLRSLLPLSSTVFFSRRVYNGVLYSTAACHSGNSLVLIRRDGSRSESIVPAVIEHICLNEHGEVILIVRRYMPLDNTLDPFRFYPDFPARVFSASLASELWSVKLQRIVCHFARYRIRSDVIVVLSLAKVFFFQFPRHYSLLQIGRAHV